MSRPTVLTRAELNAQERSARRVWVSIVVGLLGLQVAGGVVSVWLAVGDPSAAIVPNYHQSALNWDNTRRARQLTDRLQWRVDPSVGSWDSERNCRELRVQIEDVEGLAVGDLSVSATIFHHARGQEVHRLRLVAGESPGVYLGAINLARPGVWQVDLAIEGAHGIAGESRELFVQ